MTRSAREERPERMPGWRRRWRQRFGPMTGPSAYLFVLPAFLLYVVFVIYPLIQTVELSFTNWDGLRSSWDWVGLDNYERLLNDQRLRASLLNNLTWVVGSWLPQAFGLGLAALLAAQWLVLLPLKGYRGTKPAGPSPSCRSRWPQQTCRRCGSSP